MTAKQVSESFSNVTTDLALASRDGLPDALRVLLAEYPRAIWETDPGFDGLIRFWLDRHMMFRRVMVDMQEDARRLVDAKVEPAQYASRLSRYGGMFVNGLHEHHTIEDTHYFPKLSTKDPRIAGGFAILDKDHHDIDEHLNAFVASANGIAPSVLREQTEERVRMLAAYYKNLQSASKGAVARAKPEGA